MRQGYARAELQRSGPASLGEVLQALLFNTGSPMNTNVNNGGDGSVDLSQIPLPLVRKVEVLTSGAAAIYGADAVAGVVNALLAMRRRAWRSTLAMR